MTHVHAAAEELRRLWRARRVLAVTFPTRISSAEPPMAHRKWCRSASPRSGTDLPSHTRQMLSSLRDGDLLTPNTTKPGTAGIALQHPEGVLVVWIDLAEQRPFTLEDQTLLTVLAGRLGQGLQRVHQVDQQRETALALQHAILGPADLPHGFAVRYQAASRPLQVGGDWYDVVDLEDGRIALIVGDCVGHGLAAATVMGQVRSACRALLLDNPSPSAALAGLDRFAARLPGAQCTTAVCAVLNPETGELVYSSAGHPPPILVHADGTTRMLDDGHTIALGIRPDWSRPEARVTMPARATLLLYTDGLVERRRIPLEHGIARAAALVQDGRASTLDDLANHIMSGLAPSGGYQDDVALLLYRHPAPLELTFPADVSHLAPDPHGLAQLVDPGPVGPGSGHERAHRRRRSRRQRHRARSPPQARRARSAWRATALVDQVQLTITDTGIMEASATGQPTPIAAGVSPSCEGSCTTSPSTPTPPEPRFTYPRGSHDAHVAHPRHRAPRRREARAGRSGGNRSEQHRRIRPSPHHRQRRGGWQRGTLTVDLSAVEYLDSAAINALFTHADRINLVASALLMPVLTISGLTELVTIEPAPPTADH